MRPGRARMARLLAGIAGGLVAWAGLVLALRPAPPGDVALGRPEELRALMERLEAIGYAPAGEVPDRDRGRVGVTRHERGRSSPGYNLYVSRQQPTALLIDLEGRVVHRWRSPELGGSWHHVEMRPSGDLLVVAKDAYVARLDWSSRLLWRRDLAAHHDLSVAPNGDIYVLTRRRATWETPERGRFPIVTDLVTVLSSGGELRREIPLLPLFDHYLDEERFRSFDDKDRLLVGRGLERPKPPGADPYDVFHTNTIERLDRDVAGLRTRGDFLLCLRELDLVAIADLDARRVEWSWGPGELDRPHQPTLTEDGRILVFDNGMHRSFSRVVEVDPSSGEITWDYVGNPIFAFFSSHQGGVDPLPNGNVLVTQGRGGRAFEVTRAGRVVWEFWNPDVEVEDGHTWRGNLYRMERLPPEDVEPLLYSQGQSSSG